MKRRRVIDSSSDDSEDEIPDIDNIESMKYQEIRVALKQRGIRNPKGKKQELKKMLKRVLAEAKQTLGAKMDDIQSDVAVSWSLALPDHLFLTQVISRLDTPDALAFSETCTAAYLLLNRDTLWQTQFERSFGSAKADDLPKPNPKWIAKAKTRVFLKTRLPAPCDWKVRYALQLCYDVCRQCGKAFVEMFNHKHKCQFHRGEFVGRNAWPHDEQWLWTCCREYDDDAEGCMDGLHTTTGIQHYDENGKFSLW